MQVRKRSFVTLVGKQMIEGQAGDQVLGLEDVVHLASSQNETNGIAASTPALIFVLRPPRERSIASSSLPFCARCMLVCAHDSGIGD